MTKLADKVNHLSEIFIKKAWILATAESCTGGQLAGSITAFSGASKWFDCGIVTYSNEAKVSLLDVPSELISSYGAVSEEVAQAMAEGAIKVSQANISVSTTGIAGPDGGSLKKPVGMVCFGLARKGKTTHTATKLFQGNRQQIRAQAVEYALELLVKAD